MHEVGIMQEAIEVALAEAARAGADRVVAVRLRIGRLAGVEPDALALAFEVVTHTTAAEGARLEIEEVPVVCLCPACGSSFQPPGWIFECPTCRRLSSDVRGGWELEVAAVEVC
jgi:hydrogenase nickel incorporation protein HypA/HybF